MEAIDVKHALENYHKIVHAIERTKDKILVIETKQTKTGGSIIKMPENATDKTMYNLSLIENKYRLKKDIEIYEYQIYIAESFIKALPVPYGAMITDKYINNKRTVWIADKYGYHERSVMKVINRLIDKYIEAT